MAPRNGHDVVWEFCKMVWDSDKNFLVVGACSCGCPRGLLFIDKRALDEDKLEFTCVATGASYSWAESKDKLHSRFKNIHHPRTSHATDAGILYTLRSYKRFRDSADCPVTLKPSVIETDQQDTAARGDMGRAPSPSRVRKATPAVAQSFEARYNQGSGNITYNNCTFGQSPGGPSQASSVSPSGRQSHTTTNPIRQNLGGPSQTSGVSPSGGHSDTTPSLSTLDRWVFGPSNKEAVTESSLALSDIPANVKPTSVTGWSLLRQNVTRICECALIARRPVKFILDHIPAIDLVCALRAAYRRDIHGVLKVLGPILMKKTPGLYKFLHTDEVKRYIAPPPTTEEQKLIDQLMALHAQERKDTGWWDYGKKAIGWYGSGKKAIGSKDEQNPPNPDASPQT